MDSVDELAQFINAAKRTCSFDAETPVATDEGSIPIREVDVGDRVLAWHETLGREPTGRGYYTVTDAYTNVHEVLVYLTINGEEISTTPEHPFYVVDSAPLALSMAEGWLATGETQGWWMPVNCMLATPYAKPMVQPAVYRHGDWRTFVLPVIKVY